MVLMPLLSRLLTLLVILTMPLFLARLTLIPIKSLSICFRVIRSEERFSRNAETELVCRLLLEKKKHLLNGFQSIAGRPRKGKNQARPAASASWFIWFKTSLLLFTIFNFASRCSMASTWFFFECSGLRRDLHSFPTRRSSDLAFLGTINPDTNKIPKHLFQGYLNIYNNYFKAPWMPDRTEANPNELNQDDARYGFRCCHLKNIWTAPLPPETELS